MNQAKKKLLRHAMKYPGWHSCARDMQDEMEDLAAHGLLQIIRYPAPALPQFRIAIPQWAHAAIAQARPDLTPAAVAA